MSFAKTLRRVGNIFRRTRQQSELREEMQAHLDMKIEANVAAGMSPVEARRAALREFGNPLLLREESADVWSLQPLESLAQDFRYAARSLRKNPGFTAVALLTLALGIGANAAIFSILRGVLLQRLPFADPARLVRIDETGKGAEFSGFALNGVSPPDYWAYKEGNRSFDAIAAFSRGTVLAKIGRQPERVHALSVTHDIFSVLGREPLLGRGFTAAEEGKPVEDLADTRATVAVISWKLWQRGFGGGADVLGRMLDVDGRPRTIVGVMPPDFDFPTDWETDIYTPLSVSRDPKMQGARYLDVIGRLKSGITETEAKADLDLIAGRQKPFSWLVVITGLTDSVVSEVRTPLWMLAGAVGFVLLIVAANLASLSLSRVAARQREAAVRLALGAGRWRLARGMLAEAILLSLLGAAAGLVLAHFGLRALLAIAPPNLPRVHNVALNATVLWFTLGAALVTGLLLGAAPAWKAGSAKLNQAMKEGGPTLAGARQPLRSAIVAFEVTLAVVLLVGAGLMIRTMAKLRAVNTGFDSHSVLTGEIVLPETSYPKPEQQLAFMNSVLSRLRSLPGAESAAATSNLPMTGSDMVFHLVYSDDKTGMVTKSIVAGFRSISPGYFRTLRVPLLQGRDFSDADNNDAPVVGIVNQAMAKKMWPNEDPIGKKLPSGFTRGPATIVGVVGDMRFNGYDTAPKPELFVPYAQRTWAFMRLAIRTRGDAMALAPDLERQVRAIDPGQSVDKVRTMDEVLRNSTAERSFYMLLLTLFAGLALLLAAVGVFGVISYAVTQRTHEIGVRIALGAGGRQIMGMVLRKGLAPALGGLAAGLVCASALNRVLRNLLFGVKGTDPLTFVAVALVLVAAAAAACYLPARRASHVDPMRALRYE